MLRRFVVFLLVVLMQMMTIQSWRQMLPWKRLARSQTFFQTKYSFSVYDTSKLSAILEMNPDLKQKPSSRPKSQKLGRLFHFQDSNLHGSNFADVPVSVPSPPSPSTKQHEQPSLNPHSPGDDNTLASTSPAADPAPVPLSSQVSSSSSPSPTQSSSSNKPKQYHPEFKYSQKYHTLKNLYQEVRSYLFRVQGDQRTHYDEYLRRRNHLFRSDPHPRRSSESLSSSASVTPPEDYFQFTSVTFYHFHSMTVQQYQNIYTHFIPRITELNPWIKGTLIMAINEGINGQVFVPKEEITPFINLLFKLDPMIFPREIFNRGKEIEVPIIRTESFQMELHAYELLKKNEYLFRHNSWAVTDAFEPPPLLEEAIHDKQLKKKIKKEEKQLIINPKLIHDETMKNQDYDGREITEFEKGKICMMIADLNALQRLLYFQIKQAMRYLPMSKLVIKQKNQLLTDGLLVIDQNDDQGEVKRKDEESSTTKEKQETEKKSSRKLTLEEQLKLKPACNWEDAGQELTPKKWHQEIQDNLNLLNENNRKKEEIPLLLGEKMRTKTN
jgi:hypothetical protein